ncbi:MAG: glycosyltransferase 2 family protein [Actinomycetota bacterium]|nr:glycosyltransferase 2 family protein [Actinomycetota bacterium]
MRGRRLFTAAWAVVGIVIAVLGFGFVISRVAKNWDTVQSTIRDANRGWLVLGFLLAAVGMCFIAIAWKAVLASLGEHVTVRDVVRWYFPGELGKYVPGGIWPVVGRAELARRAGVRRTISYTSVAMSLVALYLSALAVVAVALPFQLSARHDNTAPFLVVLLLPIGLVALHPRVLGALLGVASKVTRRELNIAVPPWRTSLLGVALYSPAWGAIGAGTWCIARALDPRASFGQVFVAAVLSWVVGFVLVPVPGGIGVREAAFTATAGLSPGIGATVAVAARVAFMLIDVAGAVLAPIVMRRPGPKANPTAATVPDP